MAQYCTFHLDGHLFGVPVAAVQEVLKAQAVTPVPLAAPEVTGLMNLRGQIVTTVDLRVRLGLPRRDPAEPSVSVVVRTHDGGAVSLVVDRIGDVLETTDASVEAPPETVPEPVRALVTGVCKLERQLMLLLDTELATTLGAVA
jgi:purine-binding chemotaxis protein CheW